MFVPKDFKVPELRKDKYIARKLCARDVYLDYFAVMSSIDTIHKTRGGSWPTPDLNIEEDLIDLSWHQREFESKTSFAFTIMNITETECLGCIYFYPPRSCMNSAQSNDTNHDVEVSWWVTAKAYKEGLYEIVSKDIKIWVKEDWPMKNVKFTNKFLPKEFDSF
ncbi:MAG: hypothetical protein WCO33_04295 [bacterium]